MQLALPSRDYYLKSSSETELRAYHRYMTDVSVLLGADPLTAAQEFENVIIFEKQLANVGLDFFFFFPRSVDCKQSVKIIYFRHRYPRQIDMILRRFTAS